jgi:hypothetical protein
MEDMLYSVVQAFSTLANPLGTVELQALAQVIAGLDETPSTGWVHTFLIRHRYKITLRKGKKSHKRKDLIATFLRKARKTCDAKNLQFTVMESISHRRWRLPT